MTSYIQLAKDLAKGSIQNYSAQDSNTVLRKAFLAELGTETIDYDTYRENKYKIFRIIQQTVTPIINERLDSAIGRFAEVHNVAFGDSMVFDIENPELFEVALVADGTANIRRQRIDNGKLPVAVGTYEVKIYDEFYRFLAGRIDWNKLVEKVAKSYEQQLAQAVADALYSGYSTATGWNYTGTYDEGELLAILQKVEALYGSAMIVGTKAALAPIQPTYVGDDDKSEYNKLGYIGIFKGYETVALTQSFKAGTQDFALSTTDLLILPATAEKFVKVVTEGTAIVEDVQNTQGDLSIEHIFIQKAGVAVGLANKYGFVRFE